MAQQSLLEFAVNLAEEAGRNTLTYFGRGRKDPGIQYKADDSPVTEADRSSELLMRKRIQERFPQHGILGEEFEEVPGAPSAPQWILDPIDGTRAFVAGVPLYTVLVALVDAGVPRIGVIHNPVTQETVCAEVADGCYFNGARTRVADAPDPAGPKTTVCCTDYGDLSRRFPGLLSTITESGFTARTWADAYGYLLLATGRIAAMIDPIMSSWDVAPMYPIIEEAGGIITNLTGAREPLGSSVLAATESLHPPLLQAAQR